MTELYWPNDHGFIDFRHDFEVDGPGTYDIPDDADEDHYLDRGWMESEDEAEDAEGPRTADGEDVDAEGDADEAEAAAAEQDLGDLSYDELQERAKEQDIPANQSADELRQELVDTEESENGGEE